MIQVGSKIDDYEIVARLRSGGMAALFLARRKGAAGFVRPVAIKVIHPHLSQDKTFVRMFVDEAKLSARVIHPNVVHVEELGEKQSFYYLVMEYVHGCSLSQFVRSLRSRGRRVTPEMAVHIAIQTADGLHAAHDTVGDDGQLLGVVHRDVSPQNILLSYKGHVKLIDFGVAKARGRSQQTTVASLKGKLRYMAPEQAASQAVDRRTDVYALGIVLWEMLTMRTLFKAENDLKLHDLVKNPVVQPPSHFTDGIPPELDEIVMKALSPKISDRPATAQEFRRQLAQALPAALAIDADQLADLLRTVMIDTIRDQHRKLPESVSIALRTDIGDVFDRLDTAEIGEDLEAINTLTTSASNIIGSDGLLLDGGGSQHSQSTGYANALELSQAVQRSRRTRWAALGSVIALLAVVLVVVVIKPGAKYRSEPGAKQPPAAVAGAPKSEVAVPPPTPSDLRDVAADAGSASDAGAPRPQGEEEEKIARDRPRTKAPSRAQTRSDRGSASAPTPRPNPAARPSVDDNTDEKIIEKKPVELGIIVPDSDKAPKTTKKKDDSDDLGLQL
ncbi:MAG: protein kinase [Myxococcales bacterium]|nr:protein kinase [Myxococcales bacterium]